MKYVVVIANTYYWDDGIKHIFGPFDTEQKAESFLEAWLKAYSLRAYQPATSIMPLVGG